jgi:hypothetical protein
MVSPVVRVAPAVCVFMLLAGCGGGGSSQTAQSSLGGSAVKPYSSLAQLARDSKAVVIVTVTSDVTSSDGDASTGPSTETVVNVDRLLWGSLGGKGSMKLHQTGTGDMARSGYSPLLVPGRKYLLFVEPFEYQPGQPTGSYVVTGDAGEFRRELDGSFSLLSSESTDGMPQSVTESLVTNQLSQVSSSSG